MSSTHRYSDVSMCSVQWEICPWVIVVGVDRLLDAQVLGGARERVVVADGDAAGAVAARDARVVGQRLLVRGLGAAVVVEVGGLVAARRRRGRAAPGQRVLAHRDRGDVLDLALLAGRERAQAGPAHVRVDAERQRAGAVGVDRDGLDERRRDAVGRRGGARVQRGAPGYSSGLPGFVGASVVLSSVAQPGTRARPGGSRRARPSSRVDVVVAQRERVDGLVVVDAAQELALGARLVLLDLDGDQLGVRAVGRAAGRAAGDGRAQGREARQQARIAVDVGGGLVRVGLADVADGRVVRDLVADLLA